MRDDLNRFQKIKNTQDEQITIKYLNSVDKYFQTDQLKCVGPGLY